MYLTDFQKKICISLYEGKICRITDFVEHFIAGEKGNHFDWLGNNVAFSDAEGHPVSDKEKIIITEDPERARVFPASRSFRNLSEAVSST